MAVRRAWVFAGGDFSNVVFRDVSPDAGDYLIAVDRGLTYCIESGLRPDLLVGDFDSVAPDLLKRSELADVPRKEFPAAKNSSDLDLALQSLSEMSPDEVFVVGISGGRTDHMLINWMLPLQQRWPFSLEYIDDTVRARFLQGPGEVSFRAERQTTVSLVPLTDAEGVFTQGLHYPLNDATLLVGSSLGLSNIVVEHAFSVVIASGVVLVMLTNEIHDS